MSFEALVSGVERWQVGVTRGAAPQADRLVRLVVELHESAELKPLALMLDPATAREIGQALLEYADNAEIKRSSEQN